MQTNYQLCVVRSENPQTLILVHLTKQNNKCTNKVCTQVHNIGHINSINSEN